jgi:flagellin-like hook-associated protein FlgL
MQFDFHSTQSIIVERGGSAHLAKRIIERGGKSVLIVTDPGVLSAGLLNKALPQFKELALSLKVFAEVQADPPVSVIDSAVKLAQECKADFIVGFGGGSSMDVAKLVALLASGKEKLADVYGIGMAKGPRLPLILVPTTAGTGSEVTTISIVTVSESEKKGVVSPKLLPDVALLDAELTLGLPPHVTAATGIDASNVINKDFVGKISGFKADFSGTNNRVNLTVKVGETTYTANSVNTSVTSNTTVRLNSEAGGYLDIQFAANTGTAVDSQDKADIFATRINQAFSTVNFYQDRVVDSYNAAGDIITNSAVTGSLTGTSFNLQLSDFSDVKIDNISVTAPPEGATDGIIEFAINGETYRGISNIGNKLAANSIYRFTSLTNPNNSLEFRTGSTAINFDTTQKADNFEAALKNAFGIGAAGSGQSLKFQVGVTTTDTLSVRLNSIATSKLYGGATLDVLTADTAAKAADALDVAIDTVTAVRAEVGALQSRFDFAAANIESSIQNQDAARGVLLDTDIASESSAFSTAQVQLQAGISVLAQANQLPQSLLKLIG